VALLADHGLQREAAALDTDDASLGSVLGQPTAGQNTAVLGCVDARKGHSVQKGVRRYPGHHHRTEPAAGQDLGQIGGQQAQEGQHGQQVPHVLGQQAADPQEVQGGPQQQQPTDPPHLPDGVTHPEEEQQRERPTHGLGP
jgi:hypothetical protein